MTRAAMLVAGAVVIGGCDEAPPADIYGGPPVVDPEPLDEPEADPEAETDMEPTSTIYGGPPVADPEGVDEPVPPVPAYGGPPAPSEE